MSLNSPELCDRTLLQRFLDDQLSEEEQHSLEVHLDRCPDCCDLLQQLAADGTLWHDVREHLSSDAFLVEAGEGTGAHGETPPRSKIFGESDDSLTKLVLSFLGPTDDPRMLGRLGGYEIAGVVGYGGMGIVLKAYDPSLNRYAAVKVLAPHLASSGAARRRFQREAQAAAAVVHDNVVEIFGVSEVGGLPYLAMPYVRGPSLERRIRQEGPLHLEEILRIAMQTAAGLAAAHAQGLVHRDVKPANILLADGVERVKLTDFGLARAVDDASLTKSGVISGTPQYMSPEQARGEAVDARSDLFSLGSVMYAMCTGRPPFRAETSYGILRRVTDNQPRSIRDVNPAIPEWLERLVGKLHAKKADDRFASADEVSRILELCLAHVQQPTQVPLPPEVAYLPSKYPAHSESPGHWRKTLIPAAGAALLLVAAIWQSLPRATTSPSDTQGPSTRAPASPVPPPSDFARWDDGVAAEINDLDDDTQDLEQRAAKLWD